MKYLSLSRLARASVLGLSLALAPLAGVASAQTGNATDRTTTDAPRTQDRAAEQPSHQWGWLGLLGLTGLLGLMPKRTRTYTAVDGGGRPLARS